MTHRGCQNSSSSWKSTSALLLLASYASAALAGVNPSPPEKEAFSCDFSKGLTKEWTFSGGKWELKDSCLKMTDAGLDDPTKAILVVGEPHNVSAEVTISARVRLDAWSNDNWARAGVGVCAEPTSGHGLNLVFSMGRLVFVHDYVAWGPSREFRVKVGEWYRMKLYRTMGELKGKAWRDGDSEPADWMISWKIEDERLTGYPALVGCSGAPEKHPGAVSFSHCQVKVGKGLFGYYTRKASWPETMVATRKALARQEAESAGLVLETPSSRNFRREQIWNQLRRDFLGKEAQQQMDREQQDRIWTEDWPFDQVNVVAQRYARATRAGLAVRAQALARTVRRFADLEPVRELYHRSWDVENVLTHWDTTIKSLQLAVGDLTRTHGNRYPRGSKYLRQIGELREAVKAARGADGRPTDPERLLAAVVRFQALREEALLSNPLLDFNRLLLVKRKDSRTYRPMPRVPFNGMGGDSFNLLNGLPVNFQGNGVLLKAPIDNEIAVLSPVRPDGRLTTVFRPKKPAYAGDLKLNFEADRLLFSSLGSHQRFQIFEVGIDGQNLRQVTRGDEDDVDNYDPCYLPDGRILFGSSACFQSVPCQRRLDEVANLFVMNPDGSGVRRLCFDQDHDFYPTMMSDGRVLYTRWEYTDIAHAFSARLFTMNPDGTNQRAYYASNSYWPNRIFYAKPIPRHPNKFVGIITGHHGTARAGELLLFDVSKGRQHAEGVVQRIPGWDKKVEPTLLDGLVDASWPKFLHPFPLSDKYFLVSCQSTSQSRWGIYLVDVFDNMVLLHEEEGWVLFEPVPVQSTPRPPVIPSVVVPDTQEATVYLSDLYTGEGLKGIPRGTIKKLRLFTYHFNYFGTSGIEDYIGLDGPWDVRRVLGTVPVAEDGSAYFTVPANTPIAVQPLDAEGKALQLMRSWFTAMPGEAVSCVGCHERTNSAPPPRPPGSQAGPPSRIQPWYGPVRGFSWDREVQPVLDRYCVGCHDGRQSAEGKPLLDLRRAEPRRMPLSDAPFPPAYFALRRFVRSPGLEGDPRLLSPADYHADTNPLVRMLRQGHHNVRLDEESWDRLVTWMDMNAPAYGTWLEIPTVQGKKAVEQCRNRRRESLRRYGGIDEDPEAIPEVPRQLGPPVLPAPETAPAPMVVPGWPFDAREARRRQGIAQAEREVDLGQGIKLSMVLIPAGEFVMGDPEGYDNEKLLTRVKIEKPFWMGKVEVTNAQYRCFNPAHSSGLEPMLWLKWSWEDYADLNQPSQPVCRVSWDDSVAFCQWLSHRTGRTFSLPNEAQWEWACRAGTDTALYFGPRATDSAPHANLADMSLLGFTQWPRTAVGFSRGERVQQFYMVDPVNDRHRVVAPVGSFQPNRWGLLDMHGNVAEWTASADRPYPFRFDHPRHSDSRVRRVVRGGSWFDRADLARSGCRNSYWPWQRVFDVGFRVVCLEGR